MDTGGTLHQRKQILNAQHPFADKAFPKLSANHVAMLAGAGFQKFHEWLARNVALWLIARQD